MELILIHGALGAADQMEPLRARLETHFRVHIVELDGHGSTPPTAAGFSIDSLAGGIQRYLESRGIARAALFGYSMGGYVALALAARIPGRVHSVTTLGTKLAWNPEVANRETKRLDPVTIRAKVPKFAEQLERRHEGAGGWEAVLRKTAALMQALGASPVVDADLLADLAIPVRLMVGDRDALVTVDETSSAVARLRSGQLAVLPDTPHPIEQVRSALLAALITDFVVEG